jgi:hypothetical protein
MSACPDGTILECIIVDLIEIAESEGRHKDAIMIAIEQGYQGLAPILASQHKDRLTKQERIEIVEAFYIAGNEQAAIDLGHVFGITRDIRRGLNERLDLVIRGPGRRSP